MNKKTIFLEILSEKYLIDFCKSLGNYQFFYLFIANLNLRFQSPLSLLAGSTYDSTERF